MAFYDKFPYTNFQELNLDKIVQMIGDIDRAEEATAESAAAAKASEEAAAASAATASEKAAQAAASASNAQTTASSIGNYVAQINENTERINNILVSGTPTEGNAELIDIRVGANGVTYPTAGDAVRGQYSELNNEFNSFTGNVTYLKNEVRGIVSGRVPVGNIGQHISFSDNATRAYCVIDVTPGEVIACNQLMSSNFSAWTDANDIILSRPAPDGTGQGDYTVTAPAGAAKLYCAGAFLTGNIILMRRSESIRGWNAADFPFNTVIEVNIDKITGDLPESNAEGTNGVYKNKTISKTDLFMNDQGWSYSTTSEQYRAGNNITNPYHLQAGDCIHVDNSDGEIHFYVGIRMTDGTYLSRGWLTEDYYIGFECDALVLLEFVDRRQINVPSELYNHLYVYKFNSEYVQTKIEKRRALGNGTIKAINHQGFSPIAPNESRAAYKWSKLMGFDYVECDIQKSADGRFFLNHDDDLARTGIWYETASGSPVAVTAQTLISSLTSDQLINNYKSYRTPYMTWRSTILSLTEFMKICKQANLHPYIELKTDRVDVNSIMEIVKETNMERNVTYISVIPQLLDQARINDPKARLGLITNNINEDVIATANDLKTGSNDVFINANYQNTGTTEIALCRNNGFPLEVWTPNRRSIIETLDPYISGVSTDFYNASEIIYEKGIEF